MQGSFSTVPLEVNELQIAADDSLTNLILDTQNIKNPLRELQITCLVLFVLIVIALIFVNRIPQRSSQNIQIREQRSGFYD